MIHHKQKRVEYDTDNEIRIRRFDDISTGLLSLVGVGYQSLKSGEFELKTEITRKRFARSSK